MDATQYCQYSAHFSSFRNLNLERFSGEQALPRSVNPGLQPWQGDGPNSYKAVLDARGTELLKTEENGLSDGEVEFLQDKPKKESLGSSKGHDAGRGQPTTDTR